MVWHNCTERCNPSHWDCKHCRVTKRTPEPPIKHEDLHSVKIFQSVHCLGIRSFLKPQSSNWKVDDSSQLNFCKKITVFENSKKVSFNIAMFSFWVDKNYFKNAKKDPVWRVFRKAEVLPDRSILIGQRLVQNTKSKKLTLIWKICSGKIREKKKCLRGFFFKFFSGWEIFRSLKVEIVRKRYASFSINDDINHFFIIILKRTRQKSFDLRCSGK